ncbi:S8 family peptidase [Streptomyces sp. XM4193]|uniref:S8 family peptidase n=1 Tax=Streptomyces sp. XM4193 TaxID=2929782 RepID=UPI001FFBE4EA|nr:S8 family peptidase [Streptomyces sp. XM4193]MCK1797105.1 S8 family peptidase [Streptomyces sp. XM4193]
MAQHKSSKRRMSLAIGAAVAVAAGATLMALPAGASQAEGTVFGTDAKGAIDGSYVVLLKDGQVGAAKAGKDLVSEYGGKVSKTYGSTINGFSAKGLSESEAKHLAADPAVDKVVQNKKFSINATQDNPPSWGLDRIDQAETEGDNAYNYPDSAGEGVTAYVIDTGVNIEHSDFEGRATHGFDAVDGDEDADDGNGHGTHVAGTIAGAAHGVAKKADVVAVRVLDDGGSGTTEGVIAGIDWVTENASGPAVANMSLGGGADEALDAAVQKSIDAGITYTLAAGNESSDAGQGSPARVEDGITVASSTDADEQSDFSNYGSVVDIYAPGSDITAPWIGGPDEVETISGTSMAAPHVAGAAALYLGENGEAAPADVEAALVEAGTKDAITNPGADTDNVLLNVGTGEAAK